MDFGLAKQRASSHLIFFTYVIKTSEDNESELIV